MIYVQLYVHVVTVSLMIVLCKMISNINLKCLIIIIDLH